MAAFLSSLSIGLAIGAAALVVSSCALLAPLPKQKDVAERLAAFPTRGLPLEGRVMIHWSERQIPFIEADNDGDAAFALGLVHAHLRLGQMATMRMIARGRVSEMIGPLGVDIDHGLRTSRLRPRCGGDRAGHGRGHAAVGPAFRGRHQPLPGHCERTAARLRRSRPGARTLDGRGRVRHGAPRRHGRELAGLGGPAPAARTGRLGRALGASDDGRNGVAIEFRG